MGNELASCACGQKKPRPEIDEDKKPQDSPHHDSRNIDKPIKAKKKKRLFSKKRKKKDVNENDKASPTVPTNTDIKDIICVDIERPTIVKSGSSRGLPSELSPPTSDGDITGEVGSSSPRRRSLYPPSPSSEKSPYIRHPPAKPKRLLSYDKLTGETLPPKSPQVVRFIEGDIDLSKSKVTIYEDVSRLPEPAKRALKTSGSRRKLDQESQQQVSHKLDEQDTWRNLDVKVREQYDIVYVANPTDSKDMLLQDIVVVVQRELQRVYVLINPTSLTHQLPANQVKKFNTNSSPSPNASGVNGTSSTDSQQKDISASDGKPQLSQVSPLRTNSHPPVAKALTSTQSAAVSLTSTPSANNDLATARSNLQPAKLRSVANKPLHAAQLNTASTFTPKTNPSVSKESPKAQVANFASPKVQPEAAVQSNQVSWKVKGSAPTYKPVSFEVAVPRPGDQPTGLNGKTTALGSANSMAPHLPHAKVAAVALLSNKLQAAQQKETAFIAMREGLRPVSKSATTLLSDSPDATNKPPLGKSRSEDITPSRAELRSMRSFETSASPTPPLLKKSATVSASSSMSDISTDSGPTKSSPPRVVTATSSIKDRVARFNKSEDLSTAVPSFVKRSNGELNKIAPTTPQNRGIKDVQSNRNEHKANERSQSQESLSDSSQSYHSVSPIGNRGQGVLTSQSGSIADISEFESCVSNWSGYRSSSFESCETVGQSQFSGESSFYSLSSFAASSVTLRSGSCGSIPSDEQLFVDSDSFRSITTSTPTFDIGEGQGLDQAVSLDQLHFASLAESVVTHLEVAGHPSTDISPSVDEVATELILANQPIRDAVQNSVISQVELELAQVTLSPSPTVISVNLPVTSEHLRSEDIQTTMSEQEVVGDTHSDSVENDPEPTLESKDTNETQSAADEKGLEDNESNAIQTPAVEEEELPTAGAADNKGDNAIEEGEKPALGTGRIANLSKSFEATPESESSVMRNKRQSGGKAKTFDCSLWEPKPDKSSEEAIKANTPKRTSGGGNLAAKLKMFNSMGSASAPMEFGVHINTTKNLEELTKQSKSIYISMEEKKKRQSQREAEEQSNTTSKVTTVLCSTPYQSTVKVDAPRCSENNQNSSNHSIVFIRRNGYDGSVSYESFDWSMDEMGLEDSIPTPHPAHNQEVNSSSIAPDIVMDLVKHDDRYQLYVDLSENMSDSSCYSDRSKKVTDELSTDDFTTADEAMLSSEGDCEDDYLLSTIATKYSNYSGNVLDDLSNDHVEQTDFTTDFFESVQSDSESSTDGTVIVPTTVDPSEMSQAARISNFLECFARNSNELVDYSPVEPVQSSPAQYETEAGSSLAPRLPLLGRTSRADSVRSSFDIYKINEESDEETAKDYSNQTSDVTQSLDSRDFVHDSNSIFDTGNESNNNSVSTQLWVNNSTVDSPEHSETMQADGDNVIFITEPVPHIDSEIISDNKLFSNEIVEGEFVPEIVQCSSAVLQSSAVNEVVNSEVSVSDDDNVFVAREVIADSAHCIQGHSHPVGSVSNESGFLDEGFCSYSEYVDNSQISPADGQPTHLFDEPHSKGDIQASSDRSIQQAGTAQPNEPQNPEHIHVSTVGTVEHPFYMQNDGTNSQTIQAEAVHDKGQHVLSKNSINDHNDPTQTTHSDPMVFEMKCDNHPLSVCKQQNSVEGNSSVDRSHIVGHDHFMSVGTCSDMSHSMSSSENNIPSAELCESNVTECMQVEQQEAGSTQWEDNRITPLIPLVVEVELQRPLFDQETLYATTHVSQKEYEYISADKVIHINEQKPHQITHEVAYIPLYDTNTEQMINEVTITKSATHLDNADEYSSPDTIVSMPEGWVSVEYAHCDVEIQQCSTGFTDEGSSWARDDNSTPSSPSFVSHGSTTSFSQFHQDIPDTLNVEESVVGSTVSPDTFPRTKATDILSGCKYTTPISAVDQRLFSVQAVPPCTDEMNQALEVTVTEQAKVGQVEVTRAFMHSNIEKTTTKSHVTQPQLLCIKPIQISSGLVSVTAEEAPGASARPTFVAFTSGLENNNCLDVLPGKSCQPLVSLCKSNDLSTCETSITPSYTCHNHVDGYLQTNAESLTSKVSSQLAISTRHVCSAKVQEHQVSREITHSMASVQNCFVDLKTESVADDQTSVCVESQPIDMKLLLHNAQIFCQNVSHINSLGDSQPVNATLDNSSCASVEEECKASLPDVDTITIIKNPKTFSISSAERNSSGNSQGKTTSTVDSVCEISSLQINAIASPSTSPSLESLVVSPIIPGTGVDDRTPRQFYADLKMQLLQDSLKSTSGSKVSSKVIPKSEATQSYASAECREPVPAVEWVNSSDHGADLSEGTTATSEHSHNVAASLSRDNNHFVAVEAQLDDLELSSHAATNFARAAVTDDSNPTTHKCDVAVEKSNETENCDDNVYNVHIPYDLCDQIRPPTVDSADCPSAIELLLPKCIPSAEATLSPIQMMCSETLESPDVCKLHGDTPPFSAATAHSGTVKSFELEVAATSLVETACADSANQQVCANDQILVEETTFQNAGAHEPISFQRLEANNQESAGLNLGNSSNIPQSSPEEVSNAEDHMKLPEPGNGVKSLSELENKSVGDEVTPSSQEPTTSSPVPSTKSSSHSRTEQIVQGASLPPPTALGSVHIPTSPTMSHSKTPREFYADLKMLLIQEQLSSGNERNVASEHCEVGAVSSSQLEQFQEAQLSPCLGTISSTEVPVLSDHGNSSETALSEETNPTVESLFVSNIAPTTAGCCTDMDDQLRVLEVNELPNICELSNHILPCHSAAVDSVEVENLELDAAIVVFNDNCVESVVQPVDAKHQYTSLDTTMCETQFAKMEDSESSNQVLTVVSMGGSLDACEKMPEDCSIICDALDTAKQLPEHENNTKPPFKIKGKLVERCAGEIVGSEIAESAVLESLTQHSRVEETARQPLIFDADLPSKPSPDSKEILTSVPLLPPTTTSSILMNSSPTMSHNKTPREFYADLKMQLLREQFHGSTETVVPRKPSTSVIIFENENQESYDVRSSTCSSTSSFTNVSILSQYENSNLTNNLANEEKDDFHVDDLIVDVTADCQLKSHETLEVTNVFELSTSILPCKTATADLVEVESLSLNIGMTTFQNVGWVDSTEQSIDANSLESSVCEVVSTSLLHSDKADASAEHDLMDNSNDDTSSNMVAQPIIDNCTDVLSAPSHIRPELLQESFVVSVAPSSSTAQVPIITTPERSAKLTGISESESFVDMSDKASIDPVLNNLPKTHHAQTNAAEQTSLHPSGYGRTPREFYADVKLQLLQERLQGSELSFGSQRCESLADPYVFFNEIENAISAPEQLEATTEGTESKQDVDAVAIKLQHAQIEQAHSVCENYSEILPCAAMTANSDIELHPEFDIHSTTLTAQSSLVSVMAITTKSHVTECPSIAANMSSAVIETAQVSVASPATTDLQTFSCFKNGGDSLGYNSNEERDVVSISTDSLSQSEFKKVELQENTQSFEGCVQELNHNRENVASSVGINKIPNILSPPSPDVPQFELSSDAPTQHLPVGNLQYPPLSSHGKTPREFYADLKMQLMRERMSSSSADMSPTDKLNRIKEKIETPPAPSSWRAGLNNNNDKNKGPAVDMKLKVSSLSSGVKSSPLRASLPVFTSKLRNHYGRQGDTLKLQCRVDGQPKPVISWHKEGKPLLENQRMKIYEANGTYYFEVINSVKEDSGRYTVEAVNSKGSVHCSADVEIAGKRLNVTEQKTPKKLNNSFRTPSAVDRTKDTSYEISKQVDQFHSEANEMMAELDALTPRSAINGHVTHSSHCSPPSFTLNLKDCEVEEGDSFDLQCTTQGEDPGLDHSPPQFVKVLHDGVVAEGDSVTISCKSPHDDKHSMAPMAPKFTEELSDHVVTEGDSLTIEVHGSHDYHQAAAPRFVKDLQDETVTEGECVTIECRSPRYASATGAPVFVERLHDVVAEEGESLTLECLGPSSKVTSSSQQLTPPTFITELRDQQVEEGDSITIECQGPTDHTHSDSHKAEHTAPTSLHHSQPTHTQQSSSESTNEISPPRFVKNLEDDEVEEGDQLTISCKTSFKSSPVNQKPVFVKSLDQDVEVEEGESVVISCSSQQVPTQPEQLSPPKFIRELKDEEVNEGESLIIQCSQVSPLNASVTSHTDDSASFTDESVSHSAAAQPPSISKDLEDVEVTVGHQTELVMETSGSLPMDIVWVHNEDELSLDDPDYIQVSDGHVHRLIISAAFPEDSGTYICEAYNDFGEADSACELHVHEDVAKQIEPVDLKPKILQMLPETLEITDDSTVELVCRISNVEPEDVQWSKNERMARKGSRFKTLAEGDTYSYTITNCMSIDKGIYTVTASNKHGKVSCCCTIKYTTAKPDIILDSRQSAKSARQAVRAASMTTPKFTKGLSDVTVTETEDATLECKVDSSPSASIQWLCNSKEIKADDSHAMTIDSGLARLTIKETRLADQGRYTAVATNEAGTDRSSCFLNIHKPITKPQGSVPDAPGRKPVVIDISSQGATVTWQAPSYDGGSAIQGYKVEMCKATLLDTSPTKCWKPVIDLCKNMTYRATSLTPSQEFVFRVRAVNMIGEGPPSDVSDPILATDRRVSARSISTIGDSESVDYSEYSDYPESEYDPDLDEAFLEHNVIITKDKKMENQYDIIEELGKGKFGLVYLVIDKTTKRQWAAKKIKCRPSQKPDIMNEVDVMNILRHPKLVRLWEVFDHGREMVLIQEYVGGGELFERIVDDDFDLTEADCIRFTKQICDGLAYMHGKSVVHLDLKPENVMCVSKHSNQIKLIDFGLARKFKPGDDMKVLFGTPEFVAPEVINYDPVGFNTDMWSIGVITYVLLSGLSPFMGDTDAETLSNVTMIQWDFEDEAFDEISESAKDFISQLLVKKPKERLSSTDAVRHAWLHDTTKQKNGQTLSKSKSKMKKFLARRKWQKTFKAMVAITRMRSSFFKMGSKDSLLGSPTSPQEPSTAETHQSDKKCFSPPPTIEEGGDAPTPTTPTQSPMVITSYEEALSPGDTFSAATPTNTDGNIFSYPKDTDKKFCGSESITDDPLEARASPPKYETDNDQLSDTKDSGYEGRKSTREIITDVEDSFNENCVSQPIFLQPLQEEIHVIEGDCARFDVEIEANPPPTVAWFRDQEPVKCCDRIEMEVEGSKHYLIIRDIALGDDAEYECRASNEHGENSSFGELYVVSNT